MFPDRALSVGLLVALASGCGEGSGVRAAPKTALTAAIPWSATPGKSPRAYSWDGHSEVPWLSEEAPEFLPFGELGRSPSTGAYLTFQVPLPEETQPAGWSVRGTELEESEGRFGAGVELVGDSRLEIDLPDGLRPEAWTLELWVQPLSKPANHPFLDVPGLLSVFLDAEGRLNLVLPGAGVQGAEGRKPLQFRHPTALVRDEWSHLGIVLDLLDVRGVRMVLNGDPSGIRLDPALIPGRPTAFVLGDTKGNRGGLHERLDEVRVELRNTSTSELAEHHALERAAVERVRVDYDGEHETLLAWRAIQADPRLDSPAEWGRGELTHAFVDEVGLRWTAEHWRKVESAGRPVARTTHPVVSLGQGRVFTFGGETRDSHWGLSANTDDTWIFDASTKVWERIQGRAPSPRCHMPAAYSPDHEVVLLVGGWWQQGWWTGGSHEDVLHGDAWLFDVRRCRWEPVGSLGRSISDNGLVYLPEERRFVLLMEEDSWRFDPVTREWGGRQEIARTGEFRPRRSVHSYTACLDPKTGRVLLVGGILDDMKTFSDRTAWYAPGAETLQEVATGSRPAARVRPALTYDPVRDRFVLFGGVLGEDSQRFGDLWTFDPRQDVWREVPRTCERPMARGGYYGMAYDELQDAFVLPNGRHAKERWLDETWILELDEHRVGEARYLFDREAFGEGAWFAETETPAGSSVRFRFAPSADGHRFGPWSTQCPESGRFVQVEVTLVPGEKESGPTVRAMGFRSPS